MKLLIMSFIIKLNYQFSENWHVNGAGGDQWQWDGSGWGLISVGDVGR